MPLAAGAKLGPYEILSPLGAGGMGEVYKARDTRLDRIVALKVLNSSLAANPDLKARFEREARAISQLQHPNICVLHDIGHDDASQIDFLVMEYLEGESLAERLTRGALPLDQALKVCAEIAEALDKAHRAGIVHRDVKPGNVMLTKLSAKLLDFGLAKPVSVSTAAFSGSAPPLTAAPTLSSPGGQPLTAHAQSWERSNTCRRNKPNLTVASAILQEQPPPVSTLKPSAPPGLDSVIATCLAKSRTKRPWLGN
jgi:serine/threonine protein kinase